MSSKSAYILIVGCGRLGSTLANHLSAIGHKVVILDRREQSFDKLTSAFSGFRVVGDATEIQVLRDAKIEQANVLFATTTYDNNNLMVAQIAKTLFAIPTVVARVYEPAHEQIYQQLGIETISPTKLATSAFVSVLEEQLDANDTHRR